MKKDLNYYMSLPYRMEIIEDRDEGGYVISFPDLPGCITIADSKDEIKACAIEAKRVWFLSMIEDGKPIREPQ